MGKTESIKERRVDVYVDTLERKDRWTEAADEAGESLSKFVQKCVEYALEQGGPDFAELGKRAKKIQELESEVDGLRDELKQKDIVIEKLETDLRQARATPFTADEFEGNRTYDQELVEILQGTDSITSEELIRRLDVDQSDQALMAGIDNQLQRLESYGLIDHTTRGWRWVG